MNRAMRHLLVWSGVYLAFVVPALADSCRVAQARTPDAPEDAYLHGKFEEVEVSDRKNVEDSDGFMGTDILSDFLVTIDFPGHRLELAPLPPRAGESESLPSLRTEAQDQDGPGDDSGDTSENASAKSGETKNAESATTRRAEPKDRYIAPEMYSWFPIFRVGHDLIVPGMIDKNPFKLFVVDTGSEPTIVSIEGAGEVGRVFESPRRKITGLNGRVEHVYSGGFFKLQFADMVQETREAAVLDLSRLSDDLGLEISGVIGLPSLKQLTLRIDYRDGLVKFDYDPGRGQVNQ